MTTKAPPIPFKDHVSSVVRSLSGAFSELLTSVGANPRDPQSMSRQFGLNKNLAWKISKIVQADDPSLVLQQMPGAAGVKIFLRSLERAGAGTAVLETANKAIRQFDELIEIHSGDRATLEMMSSELSSAGRQQRDEYYRKLLYQGASYIWGVQARVSLKIGLVGPGAEPGLLDFASLNAYIDFRRLRQDVTWPMANRKSRNDDGSPMSTFASEAIDPRYDGVDQAPLLADFCSQPLPELRRVESTTKTSFELVEGPVGNTGARTCVVGTIQRDIPYYKTPENELGEHTASADTPSELMIVDVFFHKNFDFAIPPNVNLYSEMGHGDPFLMRSLNQTSLPLSEQLQDLGVGPLPPATPEVRGYNQMIQYMFDRMGWTQADYHGFRMKIPYPACPTAIVLSYSLPDAP